MKSGVSRPRRQVTSRDVARSAGVSQAAVSYVLAGRGKQNGISEATGERILEAARRLDYRPDTLARGLRKGYSRLVGVLTPCVTFGYFSEIVRGAEEVLSEQGYTVILAHSDEDGEKEAGKIEVLRRYRVDGIILIPAIVRGHDAEFAAMKRDRLPFVAVDKRIADPDAQTVLTDDRAGARAAVEYLIGLGHRRIAHLRGPHGISSSEERLAGYRDALRAAGIRSEGAWVTGRDWSEASGRTGALRLLRLEPRPTAIFASTDVLAWGAFDAVRDAGLRVPEDVSLVGYADLTPSARLAVPLTTVRQPARDVGRRAGEKLLNLIRTGADEPREVRLPTALVERASCARRPAAGE